MLILVLFWGLLLFGAVVVLPGSVFWTPAAAFWGVPNAQKFEICATDSKTLESKSLESLESKSQTLDSRLKTQDSDSRLKTQDSRL